MGREVRRVPPNWEHPRNGSGKYIPLMDGYGEALEYFKRSIAEKGLKEALDYHGGGPVSEDYMPDWPEVERTHFQMYEDTSEGTPISPVFETPEALARWLADTGASAFASDTATYEQWLHIARGGWAPSMVVTGGQIKSGVAFAADLDAK